MDSSSRVYDFVTPLGKPLTRHSLSDKADKAAEITPLVKGPAQLHGDTQSILLPWVWLPSSPLAFLNAPSPRQPPLWPSPPPAVRMAGWPCLANAGGAGVLWGGLSRRWCKMLFIFPLRL